MRYSGRGGVAYRRLRRRHAGDRHPVGRAADVVEARQLEERNGFGVAAVLAAYPELQLRLLLPPGPGGQPHEPTDARLVDRLERTAVDHLGLHVAVQETAFDVVAGETERGLGEIVRAEREEVRLACDPVRDE